MLAVGDGDGEGASNSGELAGAGAGDDGDGHLRGSTGLHDAGVHEGEGTGAAREGSGNALDGDVAGVALLRVSGGVHLADANGLKVAVEGFVDGVAADAGVWRVGGGENFDVEGSDGLGHGEGLWSGLGCEGEGAEKCDEGEIMDAERTARIREGPFIGYECHFVRSFEIEYVKSWFERRGT